MNFLTPLFFLFFIITLAAYRLIGQRYRYVVLFAASCFFYAWGQPKLLLLLLLVTVWTYAGGLLISLVGGNGKGDLRGSRRLYTVFFAGNILLLAAFKFANLRFNAIMPVGMSFYVFQSSTYLTDVYRKGMAPEKNFIRYGAFVTFFPTLLSGPIQKSREFLPMLRRDADASGSAGGMKETVSGGRAGDNLAIRGLALFLWGMFVKLFVANRLSGAADYIFNYIPYYTGIYYLAAAVCFALQLYSDFAAYSDMAAGCAAMLGFPLRRNFDNPFMSVTLAELWNRWHVSLNEWFIENIYIPLGGSRKGKARKYLNEMIVFFCSGLWHGQGLHFALWGVYNGALMILGQITAGLRKRLWDFLHIRTDAAPILWLRRLIVFLLFSMTFIFFRADTVAGGIQMTKGILQIRPGDLVGFYPQQMFGKSNAQFIAAGLLTLLFLAVQYLRSKEAAAARPDLPQGGYFFALPEKVQRVLLAAVLAACIFALCKETAVLNTKFVYYNF